MAGAAPSLGGLLESLVAIPSVTGDEAALVEFVEARLRPRGWTCDPIPVTPGRRNLFARRGDPALVISTHAVTVPPFYTPRLDNGATFAPRAWHAKVSP